MRKRENESIKRNKRGFSLIEMIVVIFLVGVGLVGVLAFLNINFSNQDQARKEVIAAGLAQEGVESVRNIRDYNKLNSLSWFANLYDNSAGASLCSRIDYNSLASHACLAAASYKNDICLDSSSFRYRQCATAETGNTDLFRTITITREGGADLTAGAYLKVECKVYWNNGEKNTVATDRFFDNSF